MAGAQEKLSLDDYLVWENAQPERHEFYRGETFGMVGVRRVHGMVSGNLFAALKSALRDGPCEVFTESLKVQVADEAVFYPDVFVTCHADDLRTEMVFRHPVLIVEVLSDSTQGYDRSLKFAMYRRIAELREYVLIDPDSRSVEVFRRNERGLFELHDFTGLAEMELASVQLRIALTEVFSGLEPTPAG
ncbi:MAG TPA: Uma2 family endonuclease [Thiomonas arsenitoxydans]|jgi:Uma2 family endonuclease|uniref:Putative restriction endonuclease domain-containing protein n=1 Tax=Thiomonas intermedia (strain K12) TaxID=75379 RepID=D5X5X7_THIK1|nr:Uma2 family endonuclease [Thiomonas sp.]HOI65121.1 Uma2 family endonuclease [Thiomonas arsenitoxydans]